MTEFQTPQQFQPYPSFSRWRGVDAGGLLAVLVRYSSTAHTAVHTNRPPLRSWNSFSISTAEPMANNEMKMRMPKVIVFCVGLWESALLSGPLSLWQWPTENKSKSQSRGWPLGPPECRKLCWGQYFGRFINPVPSRKPDYGPTHQLVPTTIFEIPSALVAPLHFSELKFTLYTGPPEWECMKTITLVPTLVLTEFSFFDFNFWFDWEVLYSHQIVRHSGTPLVRSQHYNHITHWNICCN